jgi:phospholipase C
MKITVAAVASLALATVAHADLQRRHVGKPKGGDSLSDRIKNVVILIQENRSFDTLVGGLT